jgi:hypothetical protein
MLMVKGSWAFGCIFVVDQVATTLYVLGLLGIVFLLVIKL